MSRRIEITVPSDWSQAVRDCLEDKERCNLGDTSEKPNMIVELNGTTKTLFFITLPGPAIGPTLATLRKNGFGVKVGRIIISPVEFMKPDLTKTLLSAELDPEQGKIAATRAGKGVKGLQHFMQARRTTEELFNEISQSANMTINTWLNLVGASFMAAGGLATNTIVFIVAAMLVSPIMGPILGMTFGYRVADWPLFKAGFWNEMKMAATAFSVGLFSGLVLGAYGNTYKWPNSAMSMDGQGYQMIISIIVSAAAGCVLAVSLSTNGGNALVGTAISAGLLPPLVNAGMLISYSFVYAPVSREADLYEMGNYCLLFYFSHVVTIVIFANIVFWLKDIDPRFRQGDDADFNDIPTLRDHIEKLKETGQDGKVAGEGVKLKNFLTTAMTDLRQDLVDFGLDLKDNTIGVTNAVTGTVRGVLRGENPLAARDSTRARAGSQPGDVEMGAATQQEYEHKPIFFKHHKVQKSKNALAEEELERSVQLPIPMSGSNKHQSLSRRDESILQASSSSDRPVLDEVINPLHSISETLPPVTTVAELAPHSAMKITSGVQEAPVSSSGGVSSGKGYQKLEEENSEEFL